MFVVSRDKLVIQKFKKGRKTPWVFLQILFFFSFFSVVPVYCNDLSDFGVLLFSVYIAKIT